MAMYNPPHPGEFIQATYLEPLGMSGRQLAEKLDVAASTLSRVLKGQSGVSPESWLEMQYAHDLWLARKSVRLTGVRKVDLQLAA
jgi:antitoxin HigA-1